MGWTGTTGVLVGAAVGAAVGLGLVLFLIGLAVRRRAHSRRLDHSGLKQFLLPKVRPAPIPHAWHWVRISHLDYGGDVT